MYVDIQFSCVFNFFSAGGENSSNFKCKSSFFSSAFCFNCLYPCFAVILQLLLITRAVAVWTTLKDTRVRFPIHNSCEAAEVMVTIIVPALNNIHFFLNVMVMIAMNTIITHFYFN